MKCSVETTIKSLREEPWRWRKSVWGEYPYRDCLIRDDEALLGVTILGMAVVPFEHDSRVPLTLYEEWRLKRAYNDWLSNMPLMGWAGE